MLLRVCMRKASYCLEEMLSEKWTFVWGQNELGLSGVESSGVGWGVPNFWKNNFIIWLLKWDVKM